MDTKGVFNVNFKKIKRFKGLIYLQEKKKKGQLKDFLKKKKIKIHNWLVKLHKAAGTC